MPVLSRWLIRLALFHLWVGFGIAALLLARKGAPEAIPAYTWRWLPAHIDLLLVGWMVELSMGVAYWIFPRLPFTLTQRGRIPLAVGAAVLLNAGVWLHVGAVLVSPWRASIPLQALGLILQAAGIVAFMIHAVPRVRSAIT